jgi:diacylglycerol kinase family enzyme
VPLGIIPRGTANAFSVALGIPTHIDSPIAFATEAADVILQVCRVHAHALCACAMHAVRVPWTVWCKSVWGRA